MINVLGAFFSMTQAKGETTAEFNIRVKDKISRY